MKMKAKDGKLYAEITLRDVVEKNDVSDMPILAEVKRLYDENAKLWELMHDMLRWMPCPTHCYHCERYHYLEGCEFEIRWRELGIEED